MAAAAVLVAQLAYYPDNFALRFDPLKHDVVRIPHDASFNAPLIDSWTVELWVQPSPTQKHPGNGWLLNLLSFPFRHPSLALSVEGFAVAQLAGRNGSWFSYEGTTKLTDGQWHHIAATWDGTNAEAEDRVLALYVDGLLEVAGGPGDDGQGQPKRPAIATRRRPAGYEPLGRCTGALCEEGLQLGGFYCCSGGGYTGRYLNGTLDEVRVWTRARTAEELRATMHTPLQAQDEAGLLLYYPFDEAGMEMGSNVVESRALFWYAILGNAMGSGRPTWTVSGAPLTCAAGSRAPPCVAQQRERGEFVPAAGFSLGTLLATLLVAGAASCAASCAITRAVLTGSAPDPFEAARRWLPTPRYTAAAQADWTMAQPPPDANRGAPAAPAAYGTM